MILFPTLKQEFIKKLGSLVREKRQAQALSIEDIALISEASFATISQFERGKCGVDSYTLYKILKSLDIDLYSLFETDSKTQEIIKFDDNDLKLLTQEIQKLTKILRKNN